MLASKPISTEVTTSPPDNLICPAVDLFDPAATSVALEKLVQDTAPDQLRNAFVAYLKDLQKSGRDKIATHFAERPFEARPATRSYAYLTDALDDHAGQREERDHV